MVVGADTLTPMIWLIRKLFWFGLFLIATFGFLVLFEHGTDNYLRNADKDFQTFKAMLIPKPDEKKDANHKTGR